MAKSGKDQDWTMQCSSTMYTTTEPKTFCLKKKRGRGERRKKKEKKNSCIVSFYVDVSSFIYLASLLLMDSCDFSNLI